MTRPSLRLSAPAATGAAPGAAPDRAPDVALAADVHAAAVDDDLVLLDVRRDAYLCLPGGAPDARPAAGGRRLEAPCPRLRAELAGQGLIAGAAVARDTIPSRAWPGAPTASALPRIAAPLRGGDRRELAGALLDVVRAYRGRPLLRILQAATRRRPAPAPPGRGLPEVVAGFHRWSPYAPVSGKCLLRSFMLRRLLQREGLDACWVFGVTTWPFGAHCWLQAGDLVLDDTCERVAAYQPILVV